MLKVIITSLPHTATSRVYQTLYTYLNSRGRVYGIFEPFNYEPVSDFLTKGWHTHYRVGMISHDYNVLPPDLRDLISLNSLWLREWRERDNPEAPFLGRYWRVILERLDSLPLSFIVKDVFLWVKLEELVDNYKHARFIVPVRDLDSLQESFERLHGWAVNMFYRYFSGSGRAEEPAGERLRVQLRRVYSRFMDIVSRVERRDNVLIVKFKEHLSDDILEGIKGWVV